MDSSNFKTSEKTNQAASPVLPETQKKPEVAPPSTPEALLPKESTEIPSTTEKMEVNINKEGQLDETIEGLKQTLKKSKRKPTQIPQVRDELTIKVENIMEQDLQDTFKEMTAVQQQEFKIKGEKTALEIRSLLRMGKVKIKKIVNLILDWLKLLPGINKFFLEQEAKIKADKIIALKRIDDTKM